MGSHHIVRRGKTMSTGQHTVRSRAPRSPVATGGGFRTARTGASFRAHLELARPANLVTAAANVLAGYAAAGLPQNGRLPYLIASGVGLYAGGVVLNDVLDRNIDAAERPERPIPSGRVSVRSGAVLGGCLLLTGAALALSASLISGALALAIGCAALLYDSASKHHSVAGPLNMGLCRGLNVLLGVSAAPWMLPERWFVALLPLAWVSAITVAGAGEVHGGDKPRAAIALLLMVGSVSAVPGLVLGWRF